MCVSQPAPNRNFKQINRGHLLAAQTRAAADAAAAATIRVRPDFNEPISNLGIGNYDVAAANAIVQLAARNATNELWQRQVLLPDMSQRDIAASLNDFTGDVASLWPVHAFEESAARNRLHLHHGFTTLSSFNALEYLDVRLCKQFATWLNRTIIFAKIIATVMHPLKQYPFFKRFAFTNSVSECKQSNQQSTCRINAYLMQIFHLRRRQGQQISGERNNMTRDETSERQQQQQQQRLSRESSDVDDSGSDTSVVGEANNQESEAPEERNARARLKLIKSLRWAGVLTFIVLISNVIILLKIFDYKSLVAFGVQARILTLQNLPVSFASLESPARDDEVKQHQQQQQFDHLMMSEQCPDSCKTLAIAATSCRIEERSKHAADVDHSSLHHHHHQFKLVSTGQLEVEREHSKDHDAKHSCLAGADIYYYLLIVALMDFLCNLNWHYSSRAFGRTKKRLQQQQQQRQQQQRLHHDHNIRSFVEQRQQEQHRQPPQRQQPTRLATGTNLSQLSADFVESQCHTASSWLTTSFLLLTSSRHLFQFVQVSLFVMLDSRPINKLAFLMSFLNYLNQTGKLALYLCRIHYYLKTISSEHEDANVAGNEDGGVADERVVVANYFFDYQSLSGQATFECHVNNWWLAAEMKLKNSNLSKVEKCLMMSRIFHLQLTIITLFVHLDTLPIECSFEVIVLICCIAESFLAMYHQYDKYYCKYLQSPIG